MSMPQHTWYAAAAGYLGMWMAMMVPMMLPAALPVLARYRGTARGLTRRRLHELTAIVLIGYFCVWALIGVGAYAGTLALSAIEVRWVSAGRWLPLATGLTLVGSAAVQFTRWKARLLMLCREDAECGRRSGARAPAAMRYGLRAGGRCSLCCGNLMLALLAIGLMEPVAMLAVALAVAAERLGPAPLRVARATGVAMAAVGVSTAIGFGRVAPHWPW
jgi:predicted metal-binding membrane protein